MGIWYGCSLLAVGALLLILPADATLKMRCWPERVTVENRERIKAAWELRRVVGGILSVAGGLGIILWRFWR